ncbi:alginate lyase family protein, partial [Priestia megaterium]|uniref:alginate lyase family protein n=1 Tax=Priestia megaterium TaxID=1404 RepID=UPI002FFF2FEC
DNTKPGDSNSWEAYPISIRLIIWSSVWELLLSISYSDEKFLTKLLASIKQQTNFLFNNLELDLANNHYTANGKALFWMGVTFPIFKESKKWLEKGKEILHKQLKKEVCSDGSQYENSTSYQLLTLLDYLEVLVLAKKNNIPLHDDFKWYIESMAQYVLSITKPDGTLPLLNDSSEGYPMDSKEIMAVAAVIFNRGDFKFVSKGANLSYLLRLLGNNGLIKYNQIKSEIPDINSVHLKDSGYIILRNGWDNQKSYFIFDAGPIGPDHCCGHAHADNLSFELFSNGETIFLDPGTFEYGNGLKRNYYRSTAAHNTVTIENKNQSTFWGAFRVDHIARVKCNNVHFGNVREVITAEHYGYQRLAQKIIHERTIDWNKSDHWIIKDLIKGNANTKTNGFLNFQVGLNCEKIFAEGNRCFLHFKSGVIVEVQFLSDSALRVELLDSFISKEWKREYTSKQIKVYFEDILP